VTDDILLRRYTNQGLSVGMAAELVELENRIEAVEEGGSGPPLLSGEGPPVNGVNTIWDIEANNNPTEGFFRLAFRGQETGPIAFDATTQEVCDELNALSTVGAGNTMPEPPTAGRSLSEDGAHWIIFINDLGIEDVEMFTIVEDTTDGTLSVYEDPPDSGITGDQVGSPPAPVGVDGQVYRDTLTGIEYTYVSHQGTKVGNPALELDPVGWVQTAPAGKVYMYDPAGNLRGYIGLDGGGRVTIFSYDADGNLLHTVVSAGEDGLTIGPMQVDVNGTASIAQTAFVGQDGPGGAVGIIPKLFTTASAAPRITGGFDPPDGGAGVAAPPGSLYLCRADTDDGRIYIKVGAADTAWERLATVP